MWILDALKQRKNDSRKAIVYKDDDITYSDLWQKSELVANWIIKNTITNKPILIYGNKDIDIVVVMIAALKVGRAYVPIDVTFPEERVKAIAAITESELIFNISDISINLENVKCIGKELLSTIVKPNGNAENISENMWVSDNENCYILFTSGSTGEPKGVQISKSNIENFVNWFSSFANIDGNIVLNQVSYSFDVSVIQIYIYLSLGKTLYCIDKNMISDFGLLFEYLRNSEISSWVSTPALIEMCVVYDQFNRMLLPKLEKIILAGEVLTKKLVKMLWKKFPGVEIINGYGPTEGTVLLTCCTITEQMLEDDENELPIGYMLDEADYKIDYDVIEASGEKNDHNRGELIVTSKSISKGYYKNKEATDKCFFKECNQKYSSYRTGDIVYTRENLIYYCGRKDFQIKLNGYRIELDDISENINRIDEVNNSIVLPVYRDGRVAYIVAFIVLNRDLCLSQAKTSIFIKKSLANFVPSYMVPKKIVVLEAFPLNVNGKIDRKKLMEAYTC